MHLDKRWHAVGGLVLAQRGVEPSRDDPRVGIMDSVELADLVVLDHNTAFGFYTAPEET